MGGMGSDFFLTSFVGTKLVFVPLRPLLIPLAKKIFLTSSPPPLRRGRGGGYA